MPTLEYIDIAMGGYVVYHDGDKQLKLFFEYGGGNCVATIYVPTGREWTNNTTIDIAERPTIMQFVAQQSITDKAPNCRFELHDSHISILTK
jgi:hypothetical protein